MVILLVVLRQTGVWIPNALFVRNSVVRGADVSAYQGTIDWKRLSSQPIRFVFLKATEGAGFQDKQFARNWEQARQSGLVVGAYHFFNFDVPASEQAENFIRTVPVQAGALPPTVDVEFYGRFNQNHPAREKVRPMLDTLLTALEKHYGKKPMLYCTESAYHAYLAGAYGQNPVWIRNVWFKPSVPTNWTFWQYTDKGRLDGTNGTERFVDLNVFCGGEQAFQRFVSG
ncbi:MAG: GH25 family lysozyme [Ethanoligenens sp.]